MMGSRYKSPRQSPWPHNGNNERWQPRSNVSSFGYRRHELADKPSPTTLWKNTSEETPVYGESYNDTYYRRESRYDRDTDSGDSEPYCPPSNAKHSVETDYAIHDLVKAASDTDFRFSPSPHPGQEAQRSFPNVNPYRIVPRTAQEQKPLVPILKKSTSNPWKTEEGGCNDATRYNLSPANVRNEFHSTPSSGPSQRAPNAGSQPFRGLLPAPNIARSQTPPRNTHPLLETPPSSGYFETLRQREQERNMFGKSHGPQGTFRLEKPPPGGDSVSPQKLAFSSSNNAPTFGSYGNRGADTRLSQNATGPGGDHHVSIQGTWRGRTAERGKLWSRGRGTWSGRPPTPRRQQHGRPNSTSAGGGTKRSRGRMACQSVSDARCVLDRKRKCASEEDGKESVQPCEAHPNVGSSPDLAQLSSKMALMENLQQDTKHWVENHFCQNDPAPSPHTTDVHEVDESRLWPPDVDPEAVSYVIFLDIDRRSFFDEAKQPFLPGTLLYLFYGDPSVLLPTREHPFYKDNKESCVYFYPDCGTDYGSFLVAAPAVISWMDQKVPQRVKFLVHGHQKQLNLDCVLRKVLFYPTSRTVDVPLLNRMLRGDFDVLKPPKVAAPTAIKTIVIRSTTTAPPVPKGKPLPNVANKNVPVRLPPPPSQHPPAPGSDSSSSGRAPQCRSPTKVQKHPPILAPGQPEPSKKERVARKKILWDL